MFANNPMGLVVKNMMDELREEGEISSPGWQDWLRDHSAKAVHAIKNRRAQKAEAPRSDLTELTPCENC